MPWRFRTMIPVRENGITAIESLARSTILSSTTLFSNNRRVQRARPLGGLEQAKAIS